MTKTTVSAAGGAMPANALSLNNPIDEASGRLSPELDGKHLSSSRAAAATPPLGDQHLLSQVETKFVRLS
jgi:hypothetical protein